MRALAWPGTLAKHSSQRAFAPALHQIDVGALSDMQGLSDMQESLYEEGY